MKLLRYGPAGQEKPGILDKDGNIRDLSAVVNNVSERGFQLECSGQWVWARAVTLLAHWGPGWYQRGRP